jgi:hypothetical protein
MTGSRKLVPLEIRLATGRQLWRLNREGRLRLVTEPPDPITGSEVNIAIRRVLQENYPGQASFPP